MGGGHILGPLPGCLSETLSRKSPFYSLLSLKCERRNPLIPPICPPYPSRLSNLLPFILRSVSTMCLFGENIPTVMGLPVQPTKAGMRPQHRLTGYGICQGPEESLGWGTPGCYTWVEMTPSLTASSLCRQHPLSAPSPQAEMTRTQDSTHAAGRPASLPAWAPCAGGKHSQTSCALGGGKLLTTQDRAALAWRGSSTPAL